MLGVASSQHKWSWQWSITEGGVATVDCVIWVGWRCSYSGFCNMGGVMPSKTPPPPCMGVQSFYKIFWLETIVGSKCLLCYTGSRQDVGRKYDETKVSKVFNAFNRVIILGWIFGQQPSGRERVATRSEVLHWEYSSRSWCWSRWPSAQTLCSWVAP